MHEVIICRKTAEYAHPAPLALIAQARCHNLGGIAIADNHCVAHPFPGIDLATHICRYNRATGVDNDKKQPPQICGVEINYHAPVLNIVYQSQCKKDAGAGKSGQNGAT
jgi:hypothetical protein